MNRGVKMGNSGGMKLLRGDRKIEILAPAGSYACFKAAISAGADAVYAGGPKFGARAYADNFTQTELLSAIEEAHIYGKKLYLTVNTLVKDGEMEELCDYLGPLYERGLDAVIIQDIGVFSAVKRHFPGLDIHASTQMTVTGSLGARFLEEQGAVRVVPARELSLNEIRGIRKETGLEIECFVHGALCYCYSGQCLLSSMIGGRSGNRGQCAQPCRLAYSAGGKKERLLSLKDICTLETIPQLVKAGIDSFKIEGRMKKPEYVAGVTEMYRKYTDIYLEKGESKFAVLPEDRERVMDLYNRGDSGSGYYFTHNGRAMLAGDRPGHGGVPAAKVVSQKGRELVLTALTHLHPQDVLETGTGKENHTLKEGVAKGERFHILSPKGRHFREGDIIRRTRNESLLATLREKYAEIKDKIPVQGYLELASGKTAVLTVLVGENTFTAYSGEIVSEALSRPLSEETVREKLCRTGDTRFYFDTLEIMMDEGVFLPMQQLNLLRRKALEGLERTMAGKCFRKPPHRYSAVEGREEYKRAAVSLCIFTETKDQLETAVRIMEEWEGTGRRVSRIYPDFHLFYDMNEKGSVLALLEKARSMGTEIVPAFPYVFRKEKGRNPSDRCGEIARLGVTDGILIRNYESYEFLAGLGFDKKIVLDHNLYVFNREAKQFWRDLGVREFTAPAELNCSELERLGLDEGELIVYGSYPVMITAQCVREAVSGCAGRPSLLMLEDRLHKHFPVKNHCDLCYNVIYNSSRLFLMDQWDRVEGLAPSRIRLQFTDENDAEAERALRMAGEVLEGRIPSRPEGEFTQGHFNRGVI